MTIQIIKGAAQANYVDMDTQDHTSLTLGEPLAATPAIAATAGAALAGGAFAGGYAAEEAADK
jgi:hypothetical protein